MERAETRARAALPRRRTRRARRRPPPVRDPRCEPGRVPGKARRRGRRDPRSLPAPRPRAPGVRAACASRSGDERTARARGGQPAALPRADGRRGRGRRAGGHRMSRLRWWAKALTPPIVLLGLRKLFPKKEPVPEPAAAEPAEWEYVPEGWGRPVPGWNAEGVLTSYERKWPA